MSFEQNNTLNFINVDDRLLAKLLISTCTLLSASLAIIVSSAIIIYVIVIYKSRHQSKKSFHISLLLTCNSCLAVICSSTIFILMQISSISGDRHIPSLQWIISWTCHARGYLLFVFLDCIYSSYVLQACYRLSRVVFSKYRHLRTTSVFFVFIPIQWLISFLIIVPILFLEKDLSTSIVYLPGDFHCHVPATNAPSMAYSVFVIYLVPLCCMCVIYFWIITHLRSSNGNTQAISTLRRRRQNKRDTIIIKRICSVIIVLLSIGFPSVAFFIRCVITGHLHLAFYRSSWMMISISYVFLSLSSIYVTPQIYRSIRTTFGYDRRRRTKCKGSTSISVVVQQRPMTMNSIVRTISSVNRTNSV